MQSDTHAACDMQRTLPNSVDVKPRTFFSNIVYVNLRKTVHSDETI